MKDFKKIADENFYSVLDRYSLMGNAGHNLKMTLQKAESSDMIMPVLGMQGMGKSTLINAILGENILPGNADETTCVPVEVRYGVDEHAEVFFENKEQSMTVHTTDELTEYVDNNYNNANEKGVSHIVLYRKRDILKNGLTIVDLPGVGSMTKENENTTTRYIENLCTAVFVIPTVPTIRKLEAMFIKGVWSQFSKPIFVQNHWGEPQVELDESVEHNTKILNQIAHELNNEFDGNILIVNAYDALAGALQKDQSLIESSHIGLLTSKIKSMTDMWDKNMESALEERFLNCINASIKYIDKKIDELHRSEEQTRREREAELRKYKEETRRLEDIVYDIKCYLSEKESDVYMLARKKAEECANSIRVEIFRVIDSGVYDGAYLSEAFKHIQEEKCQDFFSAIFEEMNNTKFELQRKLKILESVAVEEDGASESVDFEKKSEFKYEKAFKPIAAVGGSIAGIYVAPLIASGPWGWVAAAGIAIVASVAGHYAKKAIQSNRASKTKNEIAPYIDDVESTLKKTAIKKFDNLSSKIKNTLDSFIDNRRDEARRMEEKIGEATDPSSEEELNETKKYLFEKKGEIKNV